MCSGLCAELSAISQEADRLQGKIVELAEGISNLLRPDQFGDWVLVDDPLPEQEFLALQGLQRFHGVEAQEIVGFAARTLPGPPEDILKRAESAYNARLGSPYPRPLPLPRTPVRLQRSFSTGLFSIGSHQPSTSD